MRKAIIAAAAAAACLIVPTSTAFATTKGLNQIVTPDIQPLGQLSISYQQQDPNIGNPSQTQFEIGLTKDFEVAVFQGFQPNETVLNAELGLVQKGPYLLSAGFSGWASLGSGYPPDPYLVGGYYLKQSKYIAGVTRVGGTTESILGYAYQVDPRLMVQFDYQSGSGNSTTAGFTYAVTPAVSFNPAVYYSNDAPHHTFGYAVVSWSIQAWK